MKHLTAIAIAAIAATASTASASGPASNSDADLSHINGTPVKVGEHNEYYRSYPKTNIATNPIGAMVGIYNLSVSHALSSTAAIRVDGNYYAPYDSDLKAYELGVGVPIYFKHMYQGFFLEPGIIVRGDIDDMDDSASQYGPSLLVGYTTRWDSGFNASIAGGIGRDISKPDGEAMPNGYFRIGYAF